MTPIHIPQKDTARKALEHVTILKLYQEIGTLRLDEAREEQLANLGLAIIDKYIEENSNELD